MPYQVIVNTNVANPYAEVQFIDANGNKVNTPAGATVAFTSDTPEVIGITADPNNALRGKITLPANPVLGVANVRIQVQGVNDTGNVPFTDTYVSVSMSPAIPAKPPSITFSVVPPPTTAQQISGQLAELQQSNGEPQQEEQPQEAPSE